MPLDYRVCAGTSPDSVLSEPRRSLICRPDCVLIRAAVKAPGPRELQFGSGKVAMNYL
jgi:hypothetical protein